MARVKGALNARKKHKRVLKLARGYYGSRSKQYRSAKAAVMRAQRFAYVGRRLKKRDFRKLWIARINAACRMNDISYSRFMYGLKLAEVALDRKVLADIAVNDPAGFTSLVETAKAKLA
ncbi:MAG: 50S ribosomal protein L20 [Lachnospirales bacterium]